MPSKRTIDKAREDRREGKSASTQAGEFVHEEIRHIREGQHGARSTKQAIAIGLSKARRAGVKLPAPKEGQASQSVSAQAKRDLARGKSGTRKKPSAKRSRAMHERLEREGQAAATSTALSRQAKASAKRRTKSDRSAAAKKAARTKGPRVRSAAARKAAKKRAG